MLALDRQDGFFIVKSGSLILLKRIELLERQGDEAEFQRLTEAKRIQDQITAESIGQLNSVLEQGDSVPNLGDPLMTCLSCIGNRINLEFL
ncbi:hypothetical protein N9Z82_03735, partial [Akkermansiaceae bacterium]|nr:hypothetical protein [Akkermansiaceae bacterium]